MSARVQHGFIINEELVVMVPMVQWNLQQPGAIGLAVHGIGVWRPAVKIADEAHLLSLGSDADKIDRLDHLFC